MKNVLLVFSGALAGGVVAAALTGSVLAQAAPPTTQKWQQFCEGVSSIGEASAIVGRRGAEGWELAAFNGGAICFKRPAGSVAVAAQPPASPSAAVVPPLQPPPVQAPPSPTSPASPWPGY